MQLIRWFVGKVILFINVITLPKPIERDNFSQQKLDNKTKGFTIDQFEACPFCVKVRRFIRKNNLNPLQANIIKYVCRYLLKGNPLQDLEKIKHYCDLEIKRLKSIKK